VTATLAIGRSGREDGSIGVWDVDSIDLVSEEKDKE